MRRGKMGWFVALMVVFIVFAVFPIVVTFCTHPPASLDRIGDVWREEGISSYYAAAVTALPTFLLSCLTLIQSRRLFEIENRRECENTKRPYFVIGGIVRNDANNPKALSYCDHDAKYTDSFPDSDRIQWYNIRLENIGDGLAVRFVTKTEFGEAQQIEKYVREEKAITLRYAAEKYSGTTNLAKHGESQKELVITYENIVGVKFQQAIRIEEFIQPQLPEQDGQIIHDLVFYDIGMQRVIEEEDKK